MNNNVENNNMMNNDATVNQTPVAPTPTPVEAAPVAPTPTPVEAAPVAPTQTVTNGLPVNGTPQVMNNQPINNMQQPMMNQGMMNPGMMNQMPEKKNNTVYIIIIAILAVLVLVVGGLYFSGVLNFRTNTTTGGSTTAPSNSQGGSNNTTTTTTTTTKFTTTSASSVSSNKYTLKGYTFTIPSSFSKQYTNDGAEVWLHNSKTFFFSFYELASGNLDVYQTRQAEIEASCPEKIGVDCSTNFSEINGMKYFGIAYPDGDYNAIEVYFEIRSGVILAVVGRMKTDVASGDFVKAVADVAATADATSGSFADLPELDINNVKQRDFKLE